MKFHVFTLLHGTDPCAMRVHSAALDFSNKHEAHKFALLAAYLSIKHGAAKVEISVRRKLAGPNVLSIVREA